MKFTQSNNFPHINGQTSFFDKFPHISPEMFIHPNSFQQQSANANVHFSYNNNYRNQNNINNNSNNNYGQYAKSR